jgi:hypothetical protein
MPPKPKKKGEAKQAANKKAASPDDNEETADQEGDKLSTGVIEDEAD